MKQLWCVLPVALFLTLSACKKDTETTVPSNAVPVKVIIASTKPVDLKFNSLGSIESRDAPVVRSQVTGRIEKILVKEADPVKQGQLLAVIDAKDEVLSLSQAKTKQVQAEANFQASQNDLRRYKTLVDRGIVSKSDYDHALTTFKVAQATLDSANVELKSAEYQLAKTNIVSAIDGYVNKVAVTVGDEVSPGTALMQLINPEHLRAVLPFSETQALQIRPGQAVVLTSIANPDQTLNATVTAVTPSIDPKNRAFQVIVDFDNQTNSQNSNQSNWIAGSSIRGYIYALRGYQAIVVPQNSLVLQQNGYYVFIIQNNKAKAVAVQAGFKTADGVTILQGVNNGDQVVTDGANYLSDGSPVTVVGSSS